MSKSKLARAAGILMIITIISKGIGFVRDMLVASSFGATYQTDAYNMAITIPEILFAVFSLAITTTFIPLLSEAYNNKGKNEMFKFANNIMNILTVILVFLCILGWIFSPQLVTIIAPKFTGKTYDLTVTLTKISVLNIIFMGINAGYNSILQTLDDFLAPSLIGIMLNLPIIIYILLGAHSGVVGLTVVTVVGNVLRVLIQVPWLLKHGYRPKYALNMKDSRIHKMMMLIVPVLIGAGSNQLNAIVDKNMASGLPAGSISALNYASRITDVVYITFASAIVTVIYPALSREGAAKQYDNFRAYILKAVNSISIIMIPCTIGLIMLSKPTIVVLFKHGIFDERAVNMTVSALIFFSIGVPFYGIRDVFNRGLYALNDTKTSTVNGLISVGINIILNLILPRFMGLSGIALSTSIAAIVSTFLLMNSLRKKTDGIRGKEMVSAISKISVASAVMGIGVYMVYILSMKYFNGMTGNLIGLIASILTGVIIFYIIMLFLKVDEFNEVVNRMRSKLRGI